MNTRCYQCMNEYNESYDMCPYCGYEKNTPAKEMYFLQPGTVILDRYEIGVSVGSGGFGITYKAWDRVLSKIVCVKEYYPVGVVNRIPGEQVVIIYGGSKLTVSNWKDDPGHLAHVNVSDEEKKKCPLAGADCSGFVMSVYAHFGKSLPHSSSGLRSVGTKVNNPSLSTLKPGDIICYSGHVAIYIGEGKIVHASNHADGIKISNNWDYKSVITVRRIFN